MPDDFTNRVDLVTRNLVTGLIDEPNLYSGSKLTLAGQALDAGSPMDPVRRASEPPGPPR